jgi:hypothetical protein
VLHDGGFPQRALVAMGSDGVVRLSFQAAFPGELSPPELVAEAAAALAS